MQTRRHEAPHLVQPYRCGKQDARHHRHLQLQNERVHDPGQRQLHVLAVGTRLIDDSDERRVDEVEDLRVVEPGDHRTDGDGQHRLEQTVAQFP